MSYVKVISLVASLGFASIAFADAVKVSQGPSFPRCPGTNDTWKDHWSLSVNVNNASEKEDFVKLFRVLGTGGFGTQSILNFGQPDTFVQMSFDEGYFAAEPERAEEVLTKGLQTLVSLKGVSIYCTPIYSPSPALTIRN